MKAPEFLNAALSHMQDRAATYDKPEGERSMPATVAAFNALTGHELTAEQGWLFMTVLKLCRTQQGAFRADNYEDGAAYFALMGEQAAGERLHRVDLGNGLSVEGRVREMPPATLPISWTDIDTPRAPFANGEKLELLTVANAVEIVHYGPSLSFKGIVAWRPARPELATHWHVGWGCWISEASGCTYAKWAANSWWPIEPEHCTATWIEQLRPM